MEKSDQNPCGRQLRHSTRNTIPTVEATLSHKNSEVESVVAEDDSELNHLNSPLQNPLIINYIFNLLEFDDLKQCRLVCSKWNQLSFSFLKTRSVIILGCPNEVHEVKSHYPKTFEEFCQNSAIDFQAFQLTSYKLHDAAWPMDTFVDFIKDHGETMRELTINNINIQGIPSSDIPIPTYVNISAPFHNQLTHLSIDNSYGSKFKVCTNKLTSLKSISLDHCALQISENCILSPEKFIMNNVILIKNGNNIRRFLINYLLDFKNLTELTIYGTINSNAFLIEHGVLKRSFLKLILQGNVTMNNLSLNRLSLSTSEDFQWEITGKLKLRRIPFDEKMARMKFTELDFGSADINLGLLPESLEKLTLISNIEGPWCT